ncbi:hypothetical protein BC939DRAFT_4325 [Gamsiella multidivaricata]|uniref:uncharacterized protein n=1 Tax=Gamsiella multidivaricata TaxID=101098 RepID=UPI002220D33D|nr:uncharacterized protein BC939DRAFT_4325 [Gamsiella multidivaricata]KAI7832717.1 hypothetical protein BC939DRAFT_4325 [Gamsiella multidivaricata]
MQVVAIKQYRKKEKTPSRKERERGLRFSKKRVLTVSKMNKTKWKIKPKPTHIGGRKWKEKREKIMSVSRKNHPLARRAVAAEKPVYQRKKMSNKSLLLRWFHGPSIQKSEIVEIHSHYIPRISRSNCVLL